MKKAINTRFSEAIESVLKANSNLNKSKIAELLGIKPSMFTEILKKRSNVSAETIGIFCLKFNISSDSIIIGNDNNLFLNDNETMFKPALNTQDLNIEVNENETIEMSILDYLKRSAEMKKNTIWLIETKNEIILKQNNTINELKNELEKLKK